MQRRGCVTTGITINVEFVQLSPDVHLFRITKEQLVLKGFQYAGTHEIELDGEVRSTHFDRLPVRFVMDLLASATEGDGIACCGKQFQMFGCRGRKVDEPMRQMLQMEALAQDGNVLRTLGFPYRSKDRVLEETVT